MAPLETAVNELTPDSLGRLHRARVALERAPPTLEGQGRPVRPPGATSGCLAGGPGTVLQPAAPSAAGARHRALASGVLDKLDTERIVGELRRLVTDLEHHIQRLHDLVYDSVSLELGGSE